MLSYVLGFLFLLINFVTLYLFFSTNTVYSLLSFLFLILCLSVLLLILGVEFFAIVFVLLYVGLIIVFFLFVVMLVNLRSERKVTDGSWVWFFLFSFFLVITSFYIESFMLADFYGLEKLATIEKAADGHMELWWEKLSLFMSIKTYGYYLFCKHGLFVMILGLFLLLTLVISLNTVDLIRFYDEQEYLLKMKRIRQLECEKKDKPLVWLVPQQNIVKIKEGKAEENQKEVH